MNITMNLFPGGVGHALTMSYDDGQSHDLRLVELFDRYGIRGTFHLNSSNIGKPGYLSAEDVTAHFQNHEVSAHTLTHPFLTKLPPSVVIHEVLEDKHRLEDLSGRLVRGMSYPYGQYNDNVISIARSCGMEYSRTVEATNCFEIPDDFMRWHPTAHHNGDLVGLWERFINHIPHKMLLFYVWGHSLEFAAQGNWSVIEDFCRTAGGHGNIWYATNAEICEYVTASRQVVFSADRTLAYNPTATEIWFTADGKKVRLAPAQVLDLRA